MNRYIAVLVIDFRRLFDAEVMDVPTSLKILHQTTGNTNNPALEALLFSIKITTSYKCDNSACTYARSFQKPNSDDTTQTIALLDLDSTIPHVIFSDNKQVSGTKMSEVLDTSEDSQT